MKPSTDHFFSPQPWELSAAASASLTLSQFRFTLCFFLSVLAGATLRHVPTVRGRHLFSAISGFVLLYYPFGTGVLHAVVTSALTYFFMRNFRQHCGTLTWLVVFPYLIACHVLSASGEAWKAGNIDFTGAQMVATLKLIAVAMCYQDGWRSAQSLKNGAGGEGPRLGASGKLHAAAAAHDKQGSYQERTRLHALPSPLEFASYVFAFGNLLAGPFFEMRDYLDYINRRGDWASREGMPGAPSPLLPGLIRLVKGVVFAVVWVRLSASFSPEVMESEWWGTVPVWQRMVLLWVVGFSSRTKYYFAWAVAESSLIFSGLCFNGYTEDAQGGLRPRWTRFINARIRGVEFSTSATRLVADWNVCTGTWLRYYVYERLSPPGRRPTFQTVVATQTVSGIWHGLFPGYWLFFLSSALMLESSKVLFRYERAWPRWLRASPLWVAAKMVFTAYTLNYCAAAFQVLSFRSSIAVWRSVFFSGHILLLGVLLVGVVLPPRKPRPAVKPQQATEEDGAGVDRADTMPAAPGELPLPAVGGDAALKQE